MAKNGNMSWIARCQAYMKEHGCQLGEAMKALSNKNKGKGKSFRGGDGGVAANAEAFDNGKPHTGPQALPPAGQSVQQPPSPSMDTQGTVPSVTPSLGLEKLGGMFEVGGAPQMNQGGGGRRKRSQKKRGRKASFRSRSRSRSRRHRHRSRRGGSGNSSSLSFSDYN